MVTVSAETRQSTRAPALVFSFSSQLRKLPVCSKRCSTSRRTAPDSHSSMSPGLRPITSS